VDQSTLVSRVATRLNIDSNDPLYASLDEFVNEAIHHLETSNPDGYQWMRATVTTTVTTASYTFSQINADATIAKVLSVRVLDSSAWLPLNFCGPDEIQQLYPSNDRTGTPEAYYVEGSTVYLYPTPDTSYTVQIRVLNTEPDLGGASSTPSIPVVFHTAIIDCALLFAYQSLADDRRVALQEQRVATHVQRMRTFGQQYDPAPRIRVREWLT
jgi:hypothetical protein